MFIYKRLINKWLNGWALGSFCILMGWSLNTKAQETPLKFSYLTVDNGLSHTDANDIKQDTKGFIWIATLFGLDRYDGYTIKRFYNTSRLRNSAFKNRLRSIYPDSDGNIWLGTEDGIECFDSKTERYTDFSGQTHSPGNNVYSHLLLIKDNRLGAICDGQIRLFDVSGKSLKSVPLQLPKGVTFTSLINDKTGNIWLSSDKGVWILRANLQFDHVKLSGKIDTGSLVGLYRDPDNNLLLFSDSEAYKTDQAGGAQKGIIHQYIVSDGSKIRDIIQDKKHNYWVSTDRGLALLDKQLKLKQLVNSKSFNNSINTNYLDKLFIDRSECLWICTAGGGVNFSDLNAKMFNAFQRNSETANTLSGNHIKSVLEEEGRKVWIGTDGNGLNEYNFNTKKFTRYNENNSAIRLKSNDVTALALDEDKNLWIGTSKGIDVLNQERTSLLRLKGSKDFPAYGISALTKDYYGNMWFGNHNGLGCIWHDGQFNYHVRYYDMGYFILSNKSRPELFVSTTQGLNRFIINNAGEIIKMYRYKASWDSNSLSSNYPYPISQQNDSTYWIGTIGGGLDRLTLKRNGKYSIKTYGNKYGVFEDVESMEISDSGTIWMGGNGLERFDLRSQKVIRYDKNDGLQSNSFKVGSSFKGKDGRLYFGGINGLNYFYPDSIKNNTIPARPIFTDIEINNKKVAIGQDSTSFSALTQVISYDKLLKLSYLQNNFLIYFSSMHFANPLKCKYRYKLVGFDKDWKYAIGSSPGAAYSNLDYGTYTLVVEASNNDGLWSTGSASLSVMVNPPWWKSNLAKFVYFLLLISALTGIYIYQARWYRLKGGIAIRDIEEKRREEIHLQREELYQQQLQFFTNISHEFRTPLTLILGPLENLIMENKNPALNQSYQIMYRNIKRLVNLINELMNFRKVADSVIKLQVRQVVFTQFIKDVAGEFYPLANNKNIDFLVRGHEEVLTNWFDLQIVEKILFNLLNNAFKYTATGGTVTFDVFFNWDKFKPAHENSYQLLNDKKADKYIYLRVSDSGIGISKESIGNIFDRFYRVSNEHLGSGVGLALVKSLTQVHKGEIYVYSERHKGTEIIIALPLGGQHYLESEKCADNSKLIPDQLEKIDNTVLLTPAINDEPVVGIMPAEIGKQRILIVEDNDELRTFLKGMLQKYYHIYEAPNGRAGLELATEEMPDLIISDVMMPLMNGMDLCKHIKETFETSHIPFMILSAKDALDAKIEGMQSGADYYFAKPLSVDLLLLTINNLFEQKQKLKVKYTKDYYAEATELVNSSRDKEFINKLLKIIEENIQEPGLDVDFLCKHLYISRTKLYQKIKSVSDQSVSEFIRTVRLKKAVHIMTHQDISITELTDLIGFTSSAYFSTAFKREFGKSPSQFLQSHKKRQLTFVK
ncbi:two-component regulator propeller domain-containing protein [Mucilaginibacter sp. SP1R1]|uniref:hybrid sensor histidine kinase/response regulator transcription factor n=1 Tax=Mucilaginibacter sp. SP1R1 TaxID=2723091 RepID=UPI00160FC6DD|nr:two-component regulator propeller domain-containing protein [Mucilaginibacter sp. SP1R1]MBB6148333.1 signal transduction histidine kinase/ligand-binding sensor domain-containing protein/DNA-binding response OmpR family regulator [Mucilaginibacter sp. SP1R1]